MTAFFTQGVSLKMRLIVYFLVIALLVMVVGTVSVITSKNMNELYEKLKSESHEMHMVMDLALVLSQVIMPPNDYIVPGGDLNEKENFERLTKEAEEKFDELEPHALGNPEEKEIFLSAKEIYFALKEKAEEVFAIPQEEVYGSIETGQLMEEMDTLGDEAIDEIKKWHEFSDEEIKEADEALEKATSRHSYIVVIVTLLAILLAAGLGLFVSNKITKPLTKLTNSVDEISKGNFDVEIQSTSSIKEIKILSDSLARIVTSMKYAISKTGVKKEEIIAGEKSETSNKEETETSAEKLAVKKEAPIKKVVKPDIKKPNIKTTSINKKPASKDNKKYFLKK